VRDIQERIHKRGFVQERDVYRDTYSIQERDVHRIGLCTEEGRVQNRNVYLLILPWSHLHSPPQQNLATSCGSILGKMDFSGVVPTPPSPCLTPKMVSCVQCCRKYRPWPSSVLPSRLSSFFFFHCRVVCASLCKLITQHTFLAHRF
jgi:hypothetical protein